jgi:hypothetical protein
MISKIVDLEQKSERVQALITEILSTLLSMDNNSLIQTPSFIINHFVLNSSSLFQQLTLMNNVFTFASLCDVLKDSTHCPNSLITLKVTFFLIRFRNNFILRNNNFLSLH